MDFIDVEYDLKATAAPFEQWLKRPGVSDICLNPNGTVWVDEGGVFKQVDADFLTESYIDSFVALVARFNSSVLGPTIQGRLPCGARIQISRPPITPKVSFVIRRHAPVLKTLADYRLMPHFDSRDKSSKGAILIDVLEEAVKTSKTILVVGATGSGKTTFLNALIGSIPTHERLLFLEDTPELQAVHKNLLPLYARGSTDNTMQLLLKTALRSRPDRILMGEIRGPEVFDFISSLNSGHSGGMATLHAGSITQTWQRLIHLYKQNNVPAMTDSDILTEIQAVIDIIVVLKKTEQGRVCTQLYEKTEKAI